MAYAALAPSFTKPELKNLGFEGFRLGSAQSRMEKQPKPICKRYSRKDLTSVGDYRYAIQTPSLRGFVR